jgi:hypothetical protein
LISNLQPTKFLQLSENPKTGTICSIWRQSKKRKKTREQKEEKKREKKTRKKEKILSDALAVNFQFS